MELYKEIESPLIDLSATKIVLRILENNKKFKERQLKKVKKN
jgi:hypothetical protein